MKANHQRNTIVLRDASIEDLTLLQHWDKQAHVIASDPDDDWEWETELLQTYPWREQLIAELDGRPIGFLQIIDPYLEVTQYWGKVDQNLRAIDIWIGEASDLGKGYGTQMMKLAFERCFKNPKVKAIIIDPLVSNLKAHRFYERLGFQFQETRTFYDVECKVYKLQRSEWMRIRKQNT